VEAIEHEAKEFRVAGLGAKDMAGHDENALVLALEDTDPERAFEIDGEYGAHPVPPGMAMPAREWTAPVASAEGGAMCAGY